MSSVPFRILILDIVGTLVSNDGTYQARPGLKDFLLKCSENFQRIYVMTELTKEAALNVLKGLAMDGSAPPWAVELTYAHWSELKNLFYVPGYFDASDVVLVDDDPLVVAAGQEGLHVRISTYDPGQLDDYGFPEVLEVLRRRKVKA
jgi:hypothetical protein